MFQEQGFKLKSVKIVGIVEQWIVVFRRFSNEHERKVSTSSYKE